MLTLNDFSRLIGKIKSKLMLMVGRSVLAAVDNSEQTQKVQVVAMYDETITGIERFQEYGFETRPAKDAEVLVVFINGNRDQGIAACVHDRRHRPQDLAEGDVAVYTSEDGGAGAHRIHLKKSGKETDIIADKITGKATEVKLGAASGHKALCIEDLVDAINNFIGTYNTHTHSVTVPATPFTGPTAAPGTTETPLTKANYITQETEAT